MSKKFSKVTKSLQKKSIDLAEFQYYLKQGKEKRTRQGASKKKEESTLVSGGLLDFGFDRLEGLGQHLLEQNCLTLEDLNQVLADLTADYTLQNVLQVLLQKRYFDTNQFLIYLRRPWTSQPQSAYRLRWKSTTQIEFYIDSDSFSRFFGSYQILKEVARGGMGVVYQAYLATKNQTFALKVLDSQDELPENAIARFQREAKSIEKLKHPFIVKLFDVGTEKELHYIVMEYIQGETLKEYFQRNLPLKQKLSLVCKILQGLSYAHEEGIIHRDLKPENILVTEQEKPKITDFGLAKDITEELRLSKKLTQSGTVLGTPSYMSPEQALGEIKKIGVTSDIYSIGVCLYELVAGRRPFEEKEVPLLLQKVILKKVPPPSLWNKNLHPDLEFIILKALEKESECRYQTAQDFAKDLSHFVEGIPLTKKRKKHLPLFSIFFIAGLSLFLAGLPFFLIMKHYQKEKRIQKRFVAKTIQQVPLEASFSISQAISIWKESPQLSMAHQQARYELGLRTLFLAAQQRKTELVWYLLFSLPFNKNTISEHQKRKEKLLLLQEEIQEKEKQRFAYWQSKKFSSEDHEKAFFELSSFSQKIQKEKCLEILESADRYFELSFAQQNMDYLFLATDLLFHLQEKSLWEAQKKVLFQLADQMKEQNLLQYEEKERIAFMAALAKNLLFSKQIDLINDVLKLRWELEIGSPFWNKTLVSCIVLFRVEKDQKPFPPGPFFFLNSGLRKHLSFEYLIALEFYNKAVEENPFSPHAHLARAMMHFQLKKGPQALRDYRKTLELKPNYAYAYFERGVLWSKTKKWELSLKDLNKAIKLNPSNEVAYYNIGLIYSLKNKLRLALYNYNKALEINPLHKDSYHNRGITYYHLKQFEKSIEDLTKAIHIDPDDFKFYTKRGLVYYAMENYQEALQDYNRALSRNLKSYETFYQRGLVYLALKDEKSALSDFNQSASISTEFRPIYETRVQLLEKMGEWELAIFDYNRLLILAPETTFYYFGRGNLKYKLGKISEAIKDYNEVIKREPFRERVYINRGNAYIKQGKRNKAIKDFKYFLKLTKHKKDEYTIKKKRGIYALFPELK